MNREMERVITISKSSIPSLDDILDNAWRDLNPTAQEVEENFSQALENLDKKATEIYLNYEREAIKKLALEWIKTQAKPIRKQMEQILAENQLEKFIQKASELFVEFGGLVQKLEKDLGNMRKARGGKTFEKIISRLLGLIEIEAVSPKGKLKRIDLVIPSIETALNTPDRAIFLTCKRTLRERWKQEVPQVRTNQRVYLLTIDDDLSESKADEINEKGLIAFVKDEIKEREGLRDKPWIRKFSDFPEELRRR